MTTSSLPDPAMTVLTAAPVQPPPRQALGAGKSMHGSDAAMSFFCHAAAVIVLLMLGSLLVVLTIAAVPSIKRYGLKFFTSTEWRPNERGVPKRDAHHHIVYDEDNQQVMETLPPEFGALPVIYGTAISSLLSLLFAVPLSLGAALFLVRIGPKLKAPVVKGGVFGIFLTVTLVIVCAPLGGVIVTVAGLAGVALTIALIWFAAQVMPPSVEARAKFEVPLHILLAGAVVLIVHSFGASWDASIVTGIAFSAVMHVAAPSISNVASFLVEFLAAIPSIAYGIWGIFVLGPFLANYIEPGLFQIFKNVPLVRDLFLNSSGQPIPLVGRDMFCGGLILAIMIVPIITAISRDVLRAVPRAQIEGTQALGATWWQSSSGMLRYSRSALFGAIMLGLARAAGETMAVTMVIGNLNQIHGSPFMPAQTMSSLLANEFAEASSEIQRSALIEVALVLLVMSLVFNIVARYLVVGKQSRSAAAH